MKIPFQNGAYCFCSLNNKKVMKENKKKVIFICKTTLHTASKICSEVIV